MQRRNSAVQLQEADQPTRNHVQTSATVALNQKTWFPSTQEFDFLQSEWRKTMRHIIEDCSLVPTQLIVHIAPRTTYTRTMSSLNRSEPAQSFMSRDHGQWLPLEMPADNTLICVNLAMSTPPYDPSHSKSSRSANASSHSLSCWDFPSNAQVVISEMSANHQLQEQCVPKPKRSQGRVRLHIDTPAADGIHTIWSVSYRLEHGTTIPQLAKPCLHTKAALRIVYKTTLPLYKNVASPLTTDLTCL